jgi:hypothetical protein
LPIPSALDLPPTKKAAGAASLPARAGSDGPARAGEKFGRFALGFKMVRPAAQDRRHCPSGSLRDNPPRIG